MQNTKVQLPDLTIYNVKELSRTQASALALCFEAYAEYAYQEEIMEIGYNEKSEYSYIALETCNISIASRKGAPVVYVTIDFENGNEFFYDTFEEAYAEC